MNKTKIVCTLGPSSDSETILELLIKNGLNVVRLNFSHGSHEEHAKRIRMVKEIREKLDIPIAILLDTKGPEIRTGKFIQPEVYLEEGQYFTLTAREITGDQSICSITYKDLWQDVRCW